MFRGACLVVVAGTATTVDVLGSDGAFTGGMILPGLDLMKRSLAQSTAGLPLAKGRFSSAPRSTADAIESGLPSSRRRARSSARSRRWSPGRPACSPRAAHRVAARLGIPVRIVDNLVLEGLVRIAGGAA